MVLILPAEYCVHLHKNVDLCKLPGCLWVEDLNPIFIRIFDEGDVHHLAIVGLLDKLDSQLLKALACGFHIGNCKANVTYSRIGMSQNLRCHLFNAGLNRDWTGRLNINVWH